MRIFLRKIVIYILLVEVIIYLYVQSNNLKDIPVIDNIYQNANILSKLFYRKLIGHFLYNFLIATTLLIYLMSLNKVNSRILKYLTIGLFLSILFEFVQIIPNENSKYSIILIYDYLRKTWIKRNLLLTRPTSSCWLSEWRLSFWDSCS